MAKAPTKSVAQPTPPPLPKIEPLPEVPAIAPVLVVEAAPALEAFEPPQTAEVIQASTRYGFPVYVPTQKKLIAPNDIVPLILDSWVRNQLEQERGALVRAKL